MGFLAIYLAGAVFFGGLSWRFEPPRNRVDAVIFTGVFWPITVPGLLLVGAVSAILSLMATGGGFLALLLVGIPIVLWSATL